MSNSKDKVAVVTGASKGIGAFAKRLSEADAAVVVNYSSGKEDADRVVGDIKANGGKAIAIKGDVAKAADMQRLFAETKKDFNRLDVLVNNAGVIRVNAIAPGGVETEGTHSAGMIGSDFKAMIAGTPLGRIGQPDDIARVAVFLASDDSAWLTGERLTASPATGKGAARRSWSRRTSSSDAVPPRRSPPRRASHSSTTLSSRDAHIWLASAERRGWCP
jgi:NAD(P)-dependent dehydrogenase (short-subunit alcohol dehydrogenase family)